MASGSPEAGFGHRTPPQILRRTDQRRARPDMREVAERAGVAVSSVSRVLSNHPDVSERMRGKVMAAVADLGYVPDILAQSLRRQETMAVGFAIGDISNPLFAEMVKGAEARLRESGYSMLLTNSEGEPALDAAHIRLLAARRVDGMIVSIADERHSETISALRQLDMPFVVLDRDLALPCGRVLVDHRSGMKTAVNHLLDLGHRRIALISDPSVRPGVERRLALEESYAERGLPPTYEEVPAKFSVASGERSTTALLSASEPPTAIVAGGNQFMVGALRVFRRRGVQLGREISFVGCDDVTTAELYEPPVAVVRRDNGMMGQAAADLLLAALRGEEPAGEVVLPTEFVLRGSCGPLS
jgi:LacI family transcriptional regulator